MTGIEERISRATVCPHCEHAWQSHVHGRCACGCMWEEPKPPEPPPPPPTPRERLIGRVQAAIFAELDRQHEAGEIDAAGYWDPEWGRLDGEPDWGSIAAAVVAVLDSDGTGGASVSDEPCWVSDCINKPKWKIERFPLGSRGYACNEHLAVPCGYLGNEQHPVRTVRHVPLDAPRGQLT